MVLPVLFSHCLDIFLEATYCCRLRYWEDDIRVEVVARGKRDSALWPGYLTSCSVCYFAVSKISMAGNILQADTVVAKMLDNCVRNGFLLSSSFRITLVQEEEAELRWVLLGRLLYEFLRPPEPYADFMHNLSKLPASIVKCFDSLRKFVKFEEPTMVVLHLDETNILNESTLERLDRIAAEMLFDSNLFFVVIQTGVRAAMMEVLIHEMRSF